MYAWASETNTVDEKVNVGVSIKKNLVLSQQTKGILFESNVCPRISSSDIVVQQRISREKPAKGDQR